MMVRHVRCTLERMHRRVRQMTDCIASSSQVVARAAAELPHLPDVGVCSRARSSSTSGAAARRCSATRAGGKQQRKQHGSFSANEQPGLLALHTVFSSIASEQLCCYSERAQSTCAQAPQPAADAAAPAEPPLGRVRYWRVRQGAHHSANEQHDHGPWAEAHAAAAAAGQAQGTALRSPHCDTILDHDTPTLQHSSPHITCLYGYCGATAVS